MLPIDWNPTDRKLREFGLVGGAACLLLASYVWTRQDLSPAVWVLITLGGCLGVLGALCPDALRYGYLGLTLATFPIGWLVSHVVLGVIFFGVLTPLALFFRLIGRGVLERKFDCSAPSYWRPRRAAPRPEQYLRQF